MPDLIPDREGFVAGDGHRIHYEYFGRGVREAICLLNGLAMHTKAWYGFLPRLLPDLDVILYDYPGQGTSSADDVPYRIPRLAAYLSLIADELGIHRFHLMGISYGGFVALDFARQFQARLHTMTLSGILLSHEVLFQMYQDLSLRFYRAGPEAFELYTHYMYEKIFGEAFVRVFRDQVPRSLQGPGARPHPPDRGAGPVLRGPRREPAGLSGHPHADARHGRRPGPRDPSVGPGEAGGRAAQRALRPGGGQRARRLPGEAGCLLRQAAGVHEGEVGGF
jgi:pimeloyl-ACP methyl ester carboxylesterase